MNLIVKTAVAGALSLGATAAFAIGTPANNSSDLILVVENLTTLATYAYDTGISLDSVLPTGSLVSGANLNNTLAGVNLSPIIPTGLAAFLAANPASGDGWELEGGQYNGAGLSSTNSNSKAAGAAKYAYTSLIGANQGSFVLANLESFENGINQDIVSGGLMSLTGTNTSAASISAAAIQKYGNVVGDSLEALGGNVDTLYAFTGNGTTGALQSYIQGTATLGTDGTLTITGNNAPPPVPLPAAVWLFGSGLMGLVGVSRRRKAV
jgi:hypothetical protein